MSFDASIVFEPRRQRILQLLWHRERSAGEIAAACRDVTFGAVSQHLRRLREAGLIEQRREGRHRFYRVRKKAFGPMAAALEAMWAERLGVLKRLAEREERLERRRN
ncbi:MAG: helix-turn-helix domain-containing protein [Phycisphaerae bacterium]|nr:helix-turn-helix domain-containing protein [Phycisphaerae bacterium]